MVVKCISSVSMCAMACSFRLKAYSQQHGGASLDMHLLQNRTVPVMNGKLRRQLGNFHKFVAFRELVRFVLGLLVQLSRYRKVYPIMICIFYGIFILTK